MKIKDKRLPLYLTAIAAVAVTSVILRTVALFTDFDTASGHFTSDTLFTVSSVFLFAGVILAFSYLLFGRARERLVADFHGAGTYITSGILALAFIFLAVDMAGDVFSEKSNSGALENFIGIAIILSTLISVVYLFLYPYLGRRYSEKRGIAGLAVIMCLALYAIHLFMDASLPINAPNKLIDQLSYVCAALFFLGEVRLSLGRERWASYVTFGMISALLAAYSSVPSLVLYFSGLITDGTEVILSKSICESALTAALFLFISARVSKVSLLHPDEPGAVAKMISAAQKSKEETAPDTVSEPADENQLSIDDIIEGDKEEKSESETDE